MKTARCVCGLLTLGLLGLANIGGAQEAKKSEETKKTAPAPPPPLPKPGPEHEVLKSDAGVWDATVEMLGPGPPSVSKGVETSAMLGGLWGFRLCMHILSRVLSEPEDGRYRYLREYWRDDQRKFFGFFMAQALLTALLELWLKPAFGQVKPVVQKCVAFGAGVTDVNA